MTIGSLATDTDVGSMDLDSLRTEVQTWRNMWTWLSEEQRHFLSKIGTLCRFTARDFKGNIGVFIGVEMEPATYIIAVERRVYDQNSSRWYLETSEQHLPTSSLAFFEFISDRELIEEEDDSPLSGWEESQGDEQITGTGGNQSAQDN